MSDVFVPPFRLPFRPSPGRWSGAAALAARLTVSAWFSLLAGPAVWAADTGGSSVQAQDPLAAARTQVAARNWADAVTELRRVNATSSADWQNLMGYSLRKASPPDLEGASRHYREALRIAPAHRGALEYSGELALMKGDLPLAEQRLAALDKACTFGCEEYTDLKQAVQRYKAAGNRYQAAP
jgi:hypothetical protein